MGNDVLATYRKRAARYDVTANLYYLLGFREWRYRRKAVAALDLRPGDLVVEVGCGTGLNFRLLQRAVGPGGRIVGVDLTDAMLAQAERRVTKRGWRNVELVQADAASWAFPPGAAGILSTFALSLVPRCEEVIVRGAGALLPGRRWSVLDLKPPRPPWDHLVPLAMPLVRPFAVQDEHLRTRPWERIQEAMRQTLEDVRIEEYFGGVTFLASGNKGA